MLAMVTGLGFVLNWAFVHTLARNSDSIQAAEFAASNSPGDPLARYRYASQLEKTFDPNSITRALTEYEAAVAAAPHNFGFWINLGQARERDGDRPGAEPLIREVFGRYLPNRVVVAAPEDARPEGVPLLADRAAVDGRPTAYVCRQYVCQLPVTAPEELARQLERV